MAPVCGRKLLVLAALAAGCSLDFSVRPQATDAGSSPDAGDDDASVPAEDAGSDAPPAEASVDAGPDCVALADDVAAKLKAARTCVLASGHCTTTTKNQCDCDVVIASSGSAAVASYQSAVTSFKSSGCILGCTGSCASTASRNCLQSGTDTLCYPPP